MNGLELHADSRKSEKDTVVSTQNRFNIKRLGAVSGKSLLKDILSIAFELLYLFGDILVVLFYGILS